jgi:hypothetical protein
MSLLRSVVVFAGVVMIASARTMVAQTKAQESDIPSDFVELADLRGSINTEIAVLQRDVAILQDSLRTADRWLGRQFTSEPLARRDSAQLTGLTNRTPQQEERLAYALQYLKDAADAKGAPARIETTLREKQKELEVKQETARRVRARIAQLLDPEQEFKRMMSITFAALIGLVIAGFFWLALKDPSLREKVFGGQAGMQLLTLFSLVIAIILFGITGILEGKELSALLGGLSGYILGRSSDPSAATAPRNPSATPNVVEP